ncbi:MAG: NapH/MauN family ferredoxin-type protein [Bacteroidales bacterium]|nr:NapH/MauN family ferredoxin-type protein [Bacteroidales bacterium]
MISDYLISGKNKTPFKPKSVDQMPHSLSGLSYKEWRDARKKNHKWRNIRWSVLLFMNLLFVASFVLDLSVLEGSLSGSRLIGFYLMDPYNSLQLLAISSTTGYIAMLTMNFWIGFITILLFWFIFGGRGFCSWMCPYHILAEWAEKLHNYLIKKKKIKEHHYNTALRFIFFVGFILLAVLTKNLVFENLNMVGIISKSLIYGPSLLLLWVLAVILFEVFVSKRFWCRYVCPIGTTYSFVGKLSPLSIKFDLDKCGYCLECQKVCLVPHELWFVQRGKATQNVHYAGSDCTRYGLCVDVCPGNALTYAVRGASSLT